MRSLKVFGFVAMTLIALVLIGGWFYWYQWRPSNIKRVCNKSAVEIEKENTHAIFEGGRTTPIEMKMETNNGYEYDTVYTQCLRNKGL